jgi:GTP-binding nuclear protein Ran
MEHTQYKIILVGDGNVGKTTWIKKLLTSNFEKKYVATLGVEVHPIHVQTNIGLVIFNMWDCAGQEKYGGLRDGYYIHGDGAIIMYDSTNEHSKEHMEGWEYDVRRVCTKNNTFPLIKVATKCDDGIYPKLYMGISTKSNHNIMAPLLELVRKIRNDNSIEFI